MMTEHERALHAIYLRWSLGDPALIDKQQAYEDVHLLLADDKELRDQLTRERSVIEFTATEISRYVDRIIALEHERDRMREALQEVGRAFDAYLDTGIDAIGRATIEEYHAIIYRALE